jgi:hypothetical protein
MLRGLVHRLPDPGRHTVEPGGAALADHQPPAAAEDDGEEDHRGEGDRDALGPALLEGPVLRGGRRELRVPGALLQRCQVRAQGIGQFPGVAGAHLARRCETPLRQRHELFVRAAGVEALKRRVEPRLRGLDQHLLLFAFV